MADKSAHALATNLPSGSVEDDEDDSDNEEVSGVGALSQHPRGKRLTGGVQEDYSDETDSDDTGDIDEADSPVDNASHDGHFCKRTVIGTPQQLLYTGNLKPQPPALVCVAHADELPSVLTSALFHRHALGVKGPLVGISYEKTSPTVHIRVACLEEAVQEGNDLVSCIPVFRPTSIARLSHLLAVSALCPP